MLTPETIEEIQKLSLKNEHVKNMYDEYMSYQEDSSKVLFIAFNEGMKDIAKQIKDKTLSADDMWFKAMMELGKNGDKFFNTTARGRKDMNPDIEEDSNRSLLDRVADKRKNK